VKHRLRVQTVIRKNNMKRLLTSESNKINQTKSPRGSLARREALQPFWGGIQDADKLEFNLKIANIKGK